MGHKGLVRLPRDLAAQVLLFAVLVHLHLVLVAHRHPVVHLQISSLLQ